MCLIAVAWRLHPRYPLAIAANRDEARARPAAPAAIDPEAGDVYGGRDLVQGGGWLQLSARGRLAAVTNVRDGRGVRTPAPRSRGWLVRDFVRGDSEAHAFARGPAAVAGHGPFNALFCDGRAPVPASNHPAPPAAPVPPAPHATSHGAADAPWPQRRRATRAAAAALSSPTAA